VDRSEIEARARAEALVRDELARRDSLRAEAAELESRAGPARRLLAALAGSRLAGLIAGYGTAGRRDAGKSEVQRQGDDLRRRRFRLTRRKRVLEGGAPQPPEPASADSEEDVAPLRMPARTGAGPPGFCIRVAGRDWEAAERGGDVALARSLARALAERGHEAIVQIAGEADDPPAADLDVLLVLRGRPAGEPVPGRLNLFWQISHPDETELEELGRYDRVLVASANQAERLRESVAPPVEFLPQFTDTALFGPAPPTGPAHELLFVGNWRGEFRQIVWDAIQAGRPPALYGEGWDLLAPQHAVAERVPHAELHRLYSSCGILLCDHWEDMRSLGFVSNRIFDALACGAFVIADDNAGLAELLPGAVETYASPEELREKIDRYLTDPVARERTARRGREMVLAEHTVERRAERLSAIAAAAIGGREGGGSAAAAASRATGEATA
jgi:glycosyltransferase involved in cell wall biosynthesis